MNLHITVSPDSRVMVRRARATGGRKIAPNSNQVVMEYFPGENPMTSYSITFFCKDIVSADRLVDALKEIRK